MTKAELAFKILNAEYPEIARLPWDAPLHDHLADLVTRMLPAPCVNCGGTIPRFLERCPTCYGGRCQCRECLVEGEKLL